MYRLMIAPLRALAIVRNTPVCCGEPMTRVSGGIGTNGWQCAVNPLHVRT